MGSFAVQEAAMYRRLLLIVLLGLLTTACVPYEGDGYYRSEVYTADSYSYPGYYNPGYRPYYYPYNHGYYVAPSPRYYAPPPHAYYRPMAVPGYNRYYPGRGPDPRYRHGPPSYGQEWDHRNHSDGHDNHDNHVGQRGRGRDGDR